MRIRYVSSRTTAIGLMLLSLSLSACAAPAEPVVIEPGATPAGVTAAASPAPAASASSPRAMPANPPLNSGWTLVAAALADGQSAELEAQGLVEQGLPGVVRIYDTPEGKRLYRVAIGSFASRAEAERYGSEVKARYGLTQIWAARY